MFGEKVLDAAHWVGAITRGAEGSYMQLQDQVCPTIKAVICSHLDVMRKDWGKFGAACLTG